MSIEKWTGDVTVILYVSIIHKWKTQNENDNMSNDKTDILIIQFWQTHAYDESANAPSTENW